MTQLSINLNKIATLRNARGGSVPNVTDAANVCIQAGAHGITVHPRPDQRHITPDDVASIKALLSNHPNVEFNIEGNPWAGPQTNGYPGFMQLIERYRPHQCTLVPDSDTQLTSDHGFDFAGDASKLEPIIKQLKAWGCRVSLFADAGAPHLNAAKQVGADRIEIYTGPYAQAYVEGNIASALGACVETAEEAAALELGLNAGHDLDQKNLKTFVTSVPNVLEVSIGHALISEALYDGLETTAKNYLSILAGSHPHA